MGVKAKLIIDGDEQINVLSFQYRFNQEVDYTGRPIKNPVLVGLQIVVESRRDINFADWSFATDQIKQIELQVFPVIMGGKTRKLHFYDCHLIEWNTNFLAEGKQPMTETLLISSAGLLDAKSNAEYTAHWRETFIENDVPVTTITREEEKINEVYFEDLNGNPVENPKIGTEVFIVIKSENITGKSVDIDLSDKDKDFMYKDAILEEDILKNLVIKSSVQKEKLKVIAQNH